MPWPGLSLIAVARKTAAASEIPRERRVTAMHCRAATICMSDRFGAILAGVSRRRMLVMGDLMLDEFIWGKVSRISPEAPVPVVHVTGESYYPGGAANVARKSASSRPRGRGGAGREPTGRLPPAGAAARLRHRHCRRDQASAVADHDEDADHRPQPAGGARGPRSRNAAARGTDRARHRSSWMAPCPPWMPSWWPTTARVF